MDGRSTATASSDSRVRHSGSSSTTSRTSLWNPAVSLVPDRVSGPPAAHQQQHQQPVSLSRHTNLVAPPPAHRSPVSYQRTSGEAVLVMGKQDPVLFPTMTPPHMYSGTMGYPANGPTLPPSKSNFMIVDSLISPSPSARRSGLGRDQAGLPGHWSPHLSSIPTASPQSYPRPGSRERRAKEQPGSRLSSYTQPVAEVTFAHMFPGQHESHHVPHHPNHHFSPLTHSSLPHQSPVTLFAPTTHVPLHTSHPPLAPHLLLHHNQRTLVPPPPSSTCDISRSAACDNNNLSSGVIVKCEERRPESQDPSLPDTSSRRRDLNENSSEVPCSSSVSPTNSTTSSSHSGGGSKYLPKKMWIHKYTVTKQDSPTLSPDKVTDSPEDGVRENGLIHANNDSTSSSTSNSQQQHQHNGSSSHSASHSNGGAGGSSSASKSKDGKVNGATSSKKKPLNKKLKVQSATQDSEATASGSESDRAKTTPTKGQKRASVARDKKAKKTKGENETQTSDATCDPQSESHKRANSDKSDKKKGMDERDENNEDSERTEDEADEKQEKWSPGVSSSSSSREPAAKQQKRGRRPKTASASGASSPCSSTASTSSKTSQSKGKSDSKAKKTKPSDLWIDRSGQPFLQNRSCSELSVKSSPFLPKCRECKMTPSQKLKKDVGPSIFCRFYQFRKLVFDKELKAAGFSEPKDAIDEDLKLWMPPVRSQLSLEEQDARFLIEFVGDHFCTLVAQEAKAFSLHLGSMTRIAWKSVVAGVREMCDVCETTLFNIHWVCSDCGFVVCIDCYRTRREEESFQAKENRGKQQLSSKPCVNGLIVKMENTETAVCTTDASASVSPPPPTARTHQARDRDRFEWLFCNSKQPHAQEKLMLTQIVSKTALWDVCKRLHEVKKKMGCPCTCDNETTVPVLLKKLRTLSENKSLKEKDLNGCSDLQQVVKLEETAVTSSPLTMLADVAIGSSDSKPEADQALSVKSEEDAEEKSPALRDLLSNGSFKPVTESGKVSGGHEEREERQQQVVRQESETGSKKRGRKPPPILSTQLNGVVVSSDGEKGETSLKYFTRRINPIFTSKNKTPRVCSLDETKKQFPLIPHDWWCDGRLLVLKDTGNETPHFYLQLFQQQWLRHQPIVVCKVHDWLERHLWQPSVFKNKCAEGKFDLIDTETGEVFRDQPLKKFWEGFENLKSRAKDQNGRTLVYKLKDWPPGEEFGDALPEQYRDLMSCIPMPEYTTDTGSRNLVCHLPRYFGLVPDLGPKLYTAYGLASDARGTTNLHLDMSDAVNVMVYVGVFKSKDDEREHQKNVQKALEEAQVEKSQLIRSRKQRVGALWHIYDARDADKIRDMLNSHALKQGKKLHPHHDPIHDQSFYLNADLRRRLKEEYSVVGYTIVQCYGDAVFIPAGAPHQVRNLSACIKVAEDFVSPENVAHCFNLTEEFRQLSQSHDNHEDKLQIKNIIYHAIKDSLSAFPDDA